MVRADWIEFLNTPAARVVSSLTAVSVLCAIGYYVIGKLRARLRESGPTPSDFMTNFRELHAQGELSDEEFRTIKAKLAAGIQDQLKTRKPDG
ncbi:MAG TPA: SHOCT domain-containing protein [Pirellulales bacterium]|nr:SHOCT domain-containing protein [Pirellulales bacterium]